MAKKKPTATTPGPQYSAATGDQSPLSWVMESFRRLEDKFDTMDDKLDKVEKAVRDIETKEEAIAKYKKEAKDDTRDRRDFTFKIVTTVLIGAGVIVGILKLL